MTKRIVFSPSARRPGCVLLQAVFGGTLSNAEFSTLFPAETWLVFPTQDMTSYPVTDGQLAALSKMANEAVP